MEIIINIYNWLNSPATFTVGHGLVFQIIVMYLIWRDRRRDNPTKGEGKI